MSLQQYRFINQNNNNYNTENESEKRLRHLEKENSDLLERNKNLEEKLKQLENYITSNSIQTNNANIYNINLNSNVNKNKLALSKCIIKNKRNKTPSLLSNTRKSTELNKSKNSNISTNKNRNKLKANNSKKNINNNSQILSTKKSISTSGSNIKSKILPSNILKNKNGIEFKTERERDEYNLKLLNDMINEKNREIESLEYELKLQNISQKGEGYLDYELNLWQKKTNTLSSVFYQQFNNIKSEAYLDKNEFQNLIHNMKIICEKNQTYEENICEEILNKQNYFINCLDSKNKDIKRRLDKMKNIFK